MEREVVRQYRGLIRDCQNHISKEDLKQIRQAVNTLIQKGSGRTLKSVDVPLVIHSISVARIVAREIGLGKTPVIGALLYYVVDQNTLADKAFKEQFGPEIVFILFSLLKLANLNTTQTSVQSDAFRKLILTMAGDIQVLLIKIGERLAVMRNLNNATESDQLKVASESGYLYAPLAHRLGLYNVKSEMEDLSMKYLEREQYQELSTKVKASTRARNRFIREFIKPIKEQLDAEKIEFTMTGRLKSIYSIWSKMKRQNVDFEEVYDLFAIRIVLNVDPAEERALCWHVYSIITDLYTPNPQRLRDWISIPKSNGYESLHITVASPKGRWVEVQIRSERMNAIAEKGLAAHYTYKGSQSDKILDEWLGKMRDVLDEFESESDEFVDQVKLNLYSDEIYVFTPRGDLKRLPKDATLLDFAFEIHSEVGSRCTGGKVNHKNVTLRHVLQNGDMVEVTTHKNQKPKHDWLQAVVTSKAKSRIKQLLNEEKAKAAEIGKEILKRRLRNWKIVFNDENVKKLLKQYQLKYAQDLYFLISEEKIVMTDVKEFLSKKPDIVNPAEIPPPIAETKISTPRHEDFLLLEDRVENVDYKLARCCNPIVGDRIFGFVTITEGIKVHRMDCPNAKQLLSRYPYRVIQARWTQRVEKALFDAGLRITGLDDTGIMNRISEVIANELRISIQSVHFSSSSGAFESEIRLKVTDKEHLDLLIRRISKIKGVLKVSRMTDAGLK